MNKILKEFQAIKELWGNPQVRAFWLVTTCQSLGTGWFFGTYSLFILAHGLTLWHVTLLNTVFMTVDTLFNPYTGKLADKYGQKKVFLAGQLFWFTGMLVYGLGQGFWQFAMAEAISAVGSALMSDALESWLRNTMGEEICHQTMAHSGTFGSLGVIPAAVLGGVIGSKFGFQWPWLLAAASGGVVVILTLKLLWKLPESYGGQEENTLSVREVMVATAKVKPLQFAALVTFGVAFCTQPFNMFWQPVFKQSSGQTWWLGLLWIGIAIASAIGSQWAKKQANGKGLVKMILMVGVPMLFTPLAKNIIPLTTLFLVHEIGRGAYRPILFTYANRHIPDNCRSTANSIQSSMKTLGAAFGLVMFGALTKTSIPLVWIWAISALALIVLAVFAWRKK